jgi:hypothetical protein
MSKSEKESKWYVYGTTKSYENWCRKQPSARSGQTNNIVFAHFRTAKNAGIGMKPPFSGIPLTYEEHQTQHQIGQFEFMPREEWERLIKIHLEAWVKNILK